MIKDYTDFNINIPNVKMTIVKNLTRCLIIIFFLQLFLLLFSHRSTFTTPYDRPYWQERFEQSQWRLPLSQRTVGDDGLYLYVGDQLIQGANPSSLNPEMPPLGKYLIGLSILLFGNGNLYGLAINLLALVVFFFLVQTLFQKKTLSLTATTLLALDPLFTSQSFQTMVDNTQLLLLLLFFLLLAKISLSQAKKKPLLLPILLGLVLGFFSTTKLPLFSPLLLFLGTLLFLKTKKYWHAFVFVVFSFLACLLPYLRFFLLGHNFLEWLKLQKWIFSFYQQSLLQPNIGSALTTLLFNQYQNLFTHTREAIDSWTLAWPLIAILGTIGLVSLTVKNKKNRTFFLGISMILFTLGALLIYNFIPFWPRYLLLLLPFFYLGFTVFIFNLKKPKIILAAIVITLAFNWLGSINVFFPSPQKNVEQFLHNWRHGFFHDMYQQIAEDDRQGKSRQEFHQFGQRVFDGAEIETVETKIINPQWSRWQSPQLLQIKVTYFTRNLGPFTEEKNLTVIKEKDLWQIPWQWDLLISGLNEQAYLETNILEAKRGAIIAPDKRKLAQDISNYMIWVTSSEVDPAQEQAMLQYLESLFEKKIGTVGFHHRCVAKNQPQQPIPLGVPPKLIGQEQKRKLEEFPGITLTPKLGRVYLYEPTYDVGEVINTHYFECCSRLYSTTTYDGFSGIEKAKNEILKGYNGGSLVIKQEGKIIRKIIETDKKDGQDVQL
jgi:hypothetical protein